MEKSKIWLLVPNLQDHVIVQKSPDLIRLVDLNNEDFYLEIDGFSSHILGAVDGIKTVEEIFELTKVECKVSEKHYQRLETDIQNFFDDLKKREIVTLK